jgi:hypothetical protein
LRRGAIPDSNKVLDDSKDADKAIIKIQELNELAYSDLITVMDTTKPGDFQEFCQVQPRWRIG